MTDWRVTIWQDAEDVNGGTYSVAIEQRRTQGFEARWIPVSHRTVATIPLAWMWATDELEVLADVRL